MGAQPSCPLGKRQQQQLQGEQRGQGRVLLPLHGRPRWHVLLVPIWGSLFQLSLVLPGVGLYWKISDFFVQFLKTRFLCVAMTILELTL